MTSNKLSIESYYFSGTILSDAIRAPQSVAGETELLWKADPKTAGMLA